jgi:hypothetical protein
MFTIVDGGWIVWVAAYVGVELTFGEAVFSVCEFEWFAIPRNFYVVGQILQNGVVKLFVGLGMELCGRAKEQDEGGKN